VAREGRAQGDACGYNHSDYNLITTTTIKHSRFMLRTVFICALLFVSSVYLYNNGPALPHLLAPFDIMTSTIQWSSDYADWQKRAQPHSDPGAFTPTKDGLVLAVLRNAPVEHFGFTLAVFDGGDVQAGNKIAVNAKGDVLVLSPEDFDGLKRLAGEVAALPDTGNFRNTWKVKALTTSQPIDRIFVKTESEELKEVSVQGFSKTQNELKSPEGTLPGVLSELTGLVLEAREGVQVGQDTPLILRIKDVIDAKP
jgi:hypothetical protein